MPFQHVIQLSINYQIIIASNFQKNLAARLSSWSNQRLKCKFAMIT
ncbi:hypothetical protein SynBIOSE41_02416 [Synechococcus sp. BIOS-E4-1]|nr:hypothetical protein SynBIOSE41_02416 [Synechococcus sp. BIOS-E4-1]